MASKIIEEATGRTLPRGVFNCYYVVMNPTNDGDQLFLQKTDGTFYNYKENGKSIPTLEITVKRVSWFSLMGIKLFFMGITGKYKKQEFDKFPKFEMADFVFKFIKKSYRTYHWTRSV